MRAVDAQLRTSFDDDLRSADMLIHYYAASGSLLATPTPIGAGHVGSIGIGRVRREVVVKTVDGQEAPRIAALALSTLTFCPERITLERANRFVWRMGPRARAVANRAKYGRMRAAPLDTRRAVALAPRRVFGADELPLSVQQLTARRYGLA